MTDRAFRRLEAAFLLALVLGFFAALLRWPIVAYDQDLWYHLNFGRYLLAQRAVPETSFFSFLSPPRAMPDYYWLFQAFAYGVYSGWGYLGLVVARALLYAATLGGVIAFLLEGKDARARLPACVLATLYAFFLMPRGLLVRPHLLCYAFIVAALWLLEKRRRLLWLLAPLGLLWANAHGISYPILVVIVGAYLFEELLRGSLGRRLAVVSALALAAVLATPLGWRLLPVPFKRMDYAIPYANEFWPIHAKDLASLRFVGGALAPNSAFNLLLGLSIAAALWAARRKASRVSHLLLLAAGVASLVKYDRSRYECALLMLPALSAGLPRWKAPRAVSAAILGLLSFQGVLYGLAVFGPRPAYPLSRHRLAVGVAEFLRRVDVGGSILNTPDHGGYLEWALYPRYRIGIDMQLVAYGADDLDWGFHWTKDSKVLEKTLGRDRPDFIAAPMDTPEFSGLIRGYPNYVPVFFDDVAALYVDARRHPDLARDRRLPFDPLRLSEDVSSSVAARLERMRVEDPGCLKTAWRLARYREKAGDFAKVLSYGEEMIRAYPEANYGYRLKADALLGLGRREEALPYYEAALARANDRFRTELKESLVRAINVK